MRVLADIVLCTILVLVLYICPAVAQRAIGDRGKRVDKTLSLETRLAHDRVVAGTTSSAVVIVTIKDGWHINAPNPADENLIGTSFEISKHKILDSVSVHFFPGIERKFDYAESPLEVYEGATSIRVLFSVARGAKQGNYSLSAVLTYQACSDNVCLAPASIRFTIPIRVVLPGTKVRRINTEIFEQYEPQSK